VVRKNITEDYCRMYGTTSVNKIVLADLIHEATEAE
jgi:hypothetical protein